MKFFRLLVLSLLFFSKTVCSETQVLPTEFHVFLESYATNPAFTQMIQYVQLPRQIPKLIAWHRFPYRD